MRGCVARRGCGEEGAEEFSEVRGLMTHPGVCALTELAFVLIVGTVSFHLIDNSFPEIRPAPSRNALCSKKQLAFQSERAHNPHPWALA